jgi:diguanylate cyclase (GGDEF)-like protein
MKKKLRKLGFTLVLSSLALGLAALFAGGYLVFKATEDSVEEENVKAASQLGARIRILGGLEKDYAEKMNEIILGFKVERFGSSWVMDSDGFLVAHMNPTYAHAVEKKPYIGDTVVQLQTVDIPAHKMGEMKTISKARLLDLIDKFDGGFGTYNFFGENKIIAFRVIKDKGWVVAVDQPITTAFSELRRTKKFIFITSGAAGLLILAFTFFATQVILKPFYGDIEEENEKLMLIHKELEGSKNDLEKIATSLERLYDLAITMQYSGYLESHLPLVISVIQERFEFDRILLFMPDEAEEFLRCRASVGNVFEPEEKIMVPLMEGGGALAKAYHERKAFFLSEETNLSDEFRIAPPYSSIQALRSNSFGVFPLISKERIVGVLGVDNKLTRRPLLKEDLGKIENLSYKLAAMIDNTLHFQMQRNQTKEGEKRDMLTGLYNLEHFKNISEEEFSRSAETDGTVAMALFHIANFGEYNRLNGYQRGNFVLQKFGELLRKLESEQVTSSRCYGATMAALFRNSNVEQAKVTLDLFEKDFNQFSFYGEKKLSASKLVLKSVVGKYPAAEAPGFDEFFQSLDAEIFTI